MTTDNTELCLAAPTDVLDRLAALLPKFLVRVRTGSVVSPCVPSIAKGIISNALVKGYHIDKTNGDGPLEEWDGWLVIDTPGHQTFIETSWEPGQRLSE
jgi:hypothetical protein